MSGTQLDYFPNTHDLPVTPLIAARQRVECDPHTRVRDLPGDGIEIVLSGARSHAQRRQFGIFMACAGLVFSVVCGAVWRWGPDSHMTFSGLPASQVLLLISLADFGLGLMLLLIFAMQGPPRDIVLQAFDGRLHADRTLAGDRVVSEYAPLDAAWLAIEGGTLSVLTKKGPMQLVPFGEQTVNESVAILLASKLWSAYGTSIVGEPGRKGRRWLIGAQLPPTQAGS